MKPILLLAVALIGASCTGGSDVPIGSDGPVGSQSTATTTTPARSCGDTTEDGSLADVDARWHTASSLPSTASFEQFATTGVGGQSVVKFSITDFFDDPTLVWLDSNFYTLHDEWYWFRLLNGERLPGLDVEPVADPAIGPFDDVAAVYDWASASPGRLPLDLQFTSVDRLYSPMFYDLALDDPDVRPLALGSIIRTPPNADCSVGERWLLELEYRDLPTPEHIERYLDLVSATVPDEIADELLWIPRSREQEITADTMRTNGLPYGDRTIRFGDLVVPGEIEVYASGVAAGRLLLVTDDGRYALGDAGPNDIVVVQRTPDFLPPGNALITGAPQTPLAHVNVLALNRGIPNAFLGGLVDNLEISQLARVRAPVAIRAVAPDQLDIRALTDDEYEEWRARRGNSRIAVPSLDLESLPITIDLDLYASTPLSERQLDTLRPIIGGKAAGFFGLSAPGTVTMPERPLAITVRPYFEHIGPLDATIDAMLGSTVFRESARAQFVVLEGLEDFEKSFTAVGDASFLSAFLAETEGTTLGDIVQAGGLKQMIRDLPIEPATLAEIEAALARNFGDLSLQQGLRFRSSSSVEDIEGFNGAGLYSSNTGFIDPTVLPDADDHDRTIERAVTRTWSSYWNAEAVAERYFENVDQQSGGMAVLVHPRFDDELEISNGVATFTLLPPSAPGNESYQIADESVMRLNVQAGDTSVTNPDNEPGQAPEIVELRLAVGDEKPRVERIAPSTLADDGLVLEDSELFDVWEQLRDVTVAWRDRINAELPVARHVSTLTLDFEFRQMDVLWPARADGSTAAQSRIVVKQARTLEPSLRGLPAAVVDLDAPRDVLARASRIERITCPGATTGRDDVSVELFTDPLAAVDMGYSTTPLRLVVSGSPTRLADAACTRDELFSSPTEYLLALFESRAD